MLVEPGQGGPGIVHQVFVPHKDIPAKMVVMLSLSIFFFVLIGDFTDLVTIRFGPFISNLCFIGYVSPVFWKTLLYL